MSNSEKLVGQGTVRLLKNVAEQKLKAPLPEGIVPVWLNLTRAIRIADDHVDAEVDPVKRKATYQTAVEYLSGNTEFDWGGNQALATEMEKLKVNLGEISPDQKNGFLRNLERLLRLTEKIKSEQDPISLGRLTQAEGMVTARLFSYFLPEETKQLPTYPEYSRYFMRLTGSINAFDTLVDFHRDYSQGAIQIKPTVGNIGRFTLTSVPSTLYVVSHTPPLLARSLFHGVKAIVKDVKGSSSIHVKQP